MADPLGWARTTPGNIEEPPEAKKDNGWDPKKPVGAQFLNWWMNEVGKKLAALGVLTLSDANNILTIAELFRPLVITPTTTRIQTLPSVGVGAGATIEIYNLAAAQKITVEASGGDDIATYQNGSITFMALQDVPTALAHWVIIKTTDGARCAFSVNKNNSDQTSITTAETVITFGTEVFDDNGNFASNAFIPTVPGKYMLTYAVRLIAVTVSDFIELGIYKNGTVIATEQSDEDNTTRSFSITALLDADGISDSFDIRVDSASSGVMNATGAIERTFFQGIRSGE